MTLHTVMACSHDQLQGDKIIAASNSLIMVVLAVGMQHILKEQG